jgi:NAD(P) transhydrogenase subunit alpha
MIVAVPKETLAGETRVAVIPEQIEKLSEKNGWSFVVQAGAGVESGYSDEDYVAAGATICPDAKTLYGKAELTLHVQVPTSEQIAQLPEGSALMSMLWPMQNPELVKSLNSRKITSFAMDKVPRITRAQSMDVLSAMSSVSGYKAVLVASTEMLKFCPMLMTASGTIRPARALILGAGVAGLMAIGTARRLGCVVEAFDVRPATKEQVESLGAKFVEFAVEDSEDAGGYAKALDEDQQAKQLELIHQHIKDADMVITTALIPGRKAPVLVTDAMLQDMQPGSVVVDLAAIQGGNCEGAQPDQTVVKHGVKVVGPTNLPATVPFHASQMLSKVFTNLMSEICNEGGAVQVDNDNKVTMGCIITHQGDVLHERTRDAMGLPKQEAPAPPETEAVEAPSAPAS